MRPIHVRIGSGLLWGVIGGWLMSKGFRYLLWGAPHEFAWPLISVSLLLGHLKGKYVMRRAVMRIMDRVMILPQPLPLMQVYSPAYLLLMGAMITLGIGLKRVGLPPAYLGCIDLAIGFALLQGALHWIRR